MASDLEKTYREDEEARDREDEGNAACECNRVCLRNACYFHWKTFVLFLVISVYLLVGGAIFVALEGPNEQRRIEEALFNQSRLDEVERYVVGNITARGQLNETEAQALVDLISNLSQAAANLDTSRNWEYGPAVFFATTVITTIGEYNYNYHSSTATISIPAGYGSIAPVTFGGRLFFIFYALFGIPVALVFLSALGDILNRLLDRATKPLGKIAKKSLLKPIVLISSIVIGVCLFILFPAIIFNVIEEWGYFDSVYFSFVTLTTVGFGDFVPSQSEERTGRLHGLYRISSAFWIWIGLAFVSLLIARMQDSIKSIEKGFKKCKMRIEKRKQKVEAIRKERAERVVEMDDTAAEEREETERAGEETIISNGE